MKKQSEWEFDLNHTSIYPIHIMNGTSGRKSIERQATKQGYRLFKLQGSSITDRNTLFHHLAKQMHFPDYFGNNWDALEECMSDLTDWQPAKGYVVIFEDAALFCKSAPNDFLTFVDIVVEIFDDWGHERVPLLLLLEGDVSLQAFDYGPLKKRIYIHPPKH